MKEKAYKQYLGEADNWLHRGRRLLLEICIKLCFPSKVIREKSLQIFEIGAGSGKNIEVLSNFGEVDAVELEPMAIEVLKDSLHIRRLFTNKVPFLLNNKYNVICAMDFLEHVENDKQVFNWMVEHLREDGILFLTVPAYQLLFSYHDLALGHYRRYRLKQLVALNENRLLLVKKGYFNSLLFPLAFASRMLRRMMPSRFKDQEKQSSTVHPYLGRLFFQILKTEANLIRKHPLFPYGLTAFAVFQKQKSIAESDPYGVQQQNGR
jgi:SAM-dependent methyltransferase